MIEIRSAPGGARYLRLPDQEHVRFDHDFKIVAPKLANLIDDQLKRLGLPPGVQQRQTIVFLPAWAHNQLLRQRGIVSDAPAIIRQRDGSLLCNAEQLSTEGQQFSIQSREALKIAITCNAAQHSRGISGYLPIKAQLNGPTLDQNEVRRDYADRLYRMWLPAASARHEHDADDARIQAVFERLARNTYASSIDIQAHVELIVREYDFLDSTGVQKLVESGQLNTATHLLDLGEQPGLTSEGVNLLRYRSARYSALAYTAAIYAELAQQRLKQHLPPDFRVSDRIAALIFFTNPEQSSGMSTLWNPAGTPGSIIINQALHSMQDMGYVKAVNGHHPSMLHEIIHLTTNTLTEFRLLMQARQLGENRWFSSCDKALGKHFVIVELLPDALVKDLLGIEKKPAKDGVTISNGYRAYRGPSALFESLYDTDQEDILRTLVEGDPAPEKVSAAFHLLRAACERQWKQRPLLQRFGQWFGDKLPTPEE